MSKGFTLVELSIVLVIIGLIVGGVVGGQSLIQSAKLQKTVREVSEIKTALRTFILQYDYAPGDFPDADEYWTSYGNNYCTASSTFEGNGDGLIVRDYESRHVWHHLLEAALLEGKSPDSLFCTTRYNHSSDGLWRILDEDVFGGGSGGKTDQNILLLSPADSTTGAIFTPEEAYQIDKKMDDGLPYSGIVRGRDASGLPGDCVSSGEYIVSDPVLECRMEFVLGRM